MSSSADQHQQTYSIGELAREFSVTTRTIRFYEDHGLLTPRRQGRTRVYSRRDRTRLRLTLRGKRLGLSLSEVRTLIDLFDAPQGEQKQLCEFVKVLDGHRALLEQQKHDIDAVLNEITQARADCLRQLSGAEATGTAVLSKQQTVLSTINTTE